MLTMSDIQSAAPIVYAHLKPTPQYRWPILCQQIGCDVWVKHENHSPIGSFKLRGGLTYLEHLTRTNTAPNGVVAPTRGNHGQSIAYASRVYGVPAYIVVPRGNGLDKNAAISAQRGVLIEFGDDYQQAREHAIDLSKQRALHMVWSFTPYLLRGVATYPLELFTSLDGIDAIYVPIGMGSGISATIFVRDLLNVQTQVIGVVADAAPSHALSFEKKSVVPTATADTIAEGLACRTPDPGVVDLLCRRAERVVRVTDDEILDATALYLKATHNLAEYSGAAALAGLVKERSLMRNKKVAVVLTGGNLETSSLVTVARRVAQTI
jgi:threonine dehydratase